jgi:alpha-N-arabinofuranosidase
VWEVNGPDVGATNSFETPRAVDVASRRVELRGSRIDYTFPAHSITLLGFAVSPSGA